ncbi:DDE transposase [Xenorhabdus hominickii]|uniref:DDE transposase n=1 Tax=Xenorhabdus hominickii TaxID=351679 RepID=A0A2G0Q2R1_XENHO|nr:DDE transposase [Xenorhabdus hominickii]
MRWVTHAGVMAPKSTWQPTEGLSSQPDLTAGQAHESQSTIPLLDGIGIQRKNGFMKRRGKAVLADKGYSGGKRRGYLREIGDQAHYSV